ncbi:MAG: peptide chain release factor-like protein [Acidimicrobiales bacterium]
MPGGPVIPSSELRWRSSTSGGPGGQHANTSNTRVEVIFDAAASKALDAAERARVVEALGRTVRVAASDERSQWQNRRLALRRLGERIALALQVPEERRATSPSRGELARRQQARRRAQVRRSSRRWSYDPEE